MLRLLTTSVERDGAEPVLLCSNTYDDLGRLSGHAGGSGASMMSFSGEESPLPLDSVALPPAETTLMTRDYCGNHIYRNGVLERVLNDVGYADSTGYHYQVKDYRGDVRAVVAQNGTLEETNSYYPYDMLHGTSAITSTQPYKYTGKELDRENGLDWYDFGGRLYDPSINSTSSIDGECEQFYSQSPYSWTNNNPILNIDPSGKVVETIWDVANVLWDAGAATYHYIKGDDESAKNDLTDLAYDVTAAITPVLPAGISKVSKAEKIASKCIDTSSAASRTSRSMVSSRAARREVMRKEGIPTSQQPISQSKNASGREYSYNITSKGGRTKVKSVQQQTKDRSHQNQPHWEAGYVKEDNGVVRRNKYGRPKLSNKNQNKIIMNSRLRELFKLSERRSKLSMFSLELCKLVINHKFTVVDFDKSEKIQKLISQNLKNSQKNCLTFFSTPFHSKELLENVLSCINQVNKDCVYIGIGLSEQCGYARLDSIMDFNTKFNYLDESTGIINFYSCDIENELIIDFYEEDEVWYYDLEIRGDNWTSSIENITSN